MYFCELKTALHLQSVCFSFYYLVIKFLKIAKFILLSIMLLNVFLIRRFISNEHNTKLFLGYA